MSLRWTLSVYYSLFLLLSFSLRSHRWTAAPHTSPHTSPRGPLCTIIPVLWSRVLHTLERFTCGIWSNLANWWASKTGMWCGAKHIFIRCPGTESHSVCFLLSFLSPIWSISSPTQTWAVGLRPFSPLGDLSVVLVLVDYDFFSRFVIFYAFFLCRMTYFLRNLRAHLW